MSMEVARTVTSAGKLRRAPEGWVFVTNDPEVLKAPNRLVSLLHREKRVVLIIDTTIETFVVRDIANLRETAGARVPSDPRAVWRIGRAPFKDLGDIGRAVDAVLTPAQ